MILLHFVRHQLNLSEKLVIDCNFCEINFKGQTLDLDYFYNRMYFYSPIFQKCLSPPPRPVHFEWENRPISRGLPAKRTQKLLRMVKIKKSRFQPRKVTCRIQPVKHTLSLHFRASMCFQSYANSWTNMVPVMEGLFLQIGWTTSGKALERSANVTIYQIRKN